MTTGEWFVYTLSDPRTEKVRYVGCTIDPARRFKAHLSVTTAGRENPINRQKARWISGLMSQGREPVMTIVERGPLDREAAVKAERKWIKEYRSKGMKLFNSRYAADYPKPVSEAVRLRQSLSAQARAQREGEQERLAAISRKAAKERRGTSMNPEAVRRQVEARKRNGKTWTEEARARQAANNTGKTHSDETRRKTSEANKGRVVSAEARAKMSAAKKGKKPWNAGQKLSGRDKGKPE